MNILNIDLNHKNNLLSMADFLYVKYIFTCKMQYFKKKYSLFLGNLKVKMLLCTSFFPVLTENRNRKSPKEPCLSSAAPFSCFPLHFHKLLAVPDGLRSPVCRE